MLEVTFRSFAGAYSVGLRIRAACEAGGGSIHAARPTEQLPNLNRALEEAKLPLPRWVKLGQIAQAQFP